jgi:type III secretion protein L
MVIWLRSDRRGLEPDASRVGVHGDVVPRDAFGALMQIDEAYAQLAADREAILAEAGLEAEGILAAAREEAQALVAEARREFETAADHGYRDGERRAVSEWMERLALSHADERRLQAKMRERLAQSVTVAVEQIVSVQESRSLFEKALSAVDRIVEGATYLRVSVSPTDYEVANSAFERLAARWRELGRPFPLSVVADKRLPPGSCLCESDFGAVDASLATQLRAMRSAVSRALKQSVNEMQREGSWSAPGAPREREEALDELGEFERCETGDELDDDDETVARHDAGHADHERGR